MRKFGAIIVALSLLAPSAFAATSDAPLAPGKPAGVQQAQVFHPFAIWLVGFAIVGGGILLATSAGNNNTISTSVTGTAG